MTIFVPYTVASGDTERIGVEMNGRRRWIIPPRYRQVAKQQWVLLADAIYCDGKNIFRYRKGFMWNGASVPKLLQWYEGAGDHLPASLRHDYAYQYHWAETYDLFGFEWVRARVGKGWTDAEFRADIELAGTRETKSVNLWLQVHVWGWLPWLRGTCNGRCYACPCKAGAWCPYRHDLPPMSDKIIHTPGDET